ncbi:SURF1 family protein [Roseicyclus persicicus]|uniref:SURF1-like protein n=1 Tax=Roseicyclus persicicus TaxID=2650661 RepID=A0A7X6GWI7_9RHOB|nr:SURF1 family protein [Roseibacterium persicicum]NKX43685.1 SURF1 family protein [Roseibacterium persicicum]
MGRVIGALVLGLGGAAILLSLGVWQVQRLGWKQGVLVEIEARIAADPVDLPATPDPVADRYLPVAVTGVFGEGFVRVLVSQRGIGAGYRIISPLETAEGRRLLVDRGVVPVADAVPLAPEGVVTVTGNLHWPEERDGFTPENDLDDNIWFAREVDVLAAHLETGPVLVIARSLDPAEAGVTPLPVGTEGIPNDHLNYAITWFSLAAVWLGMTGFLLWRIRRRSE